MFSFKKEEEKSWQRNLSICCFIPQMHTTTGTKSGWGQNPKTPSEYPTRVTGAQVLEPSTAACQSAGSWIAEHSSWDLNLTKDMDVPSSNIVTHLPQQLFLKEFPWDAFNRCSITPSWPPSNLSVFKHWKASIRCSGKDATWDICIPYPSAWIWVPLLLLIPAAC